MTEQPLVSIAIPAFNAEFFRGTLASAVAQDYPNLEIIVCDDSADGEIEAMGNHGLRAVPSRANFVLVLFEGRLTAEQAFHGLMEAGYIVRWLPGQGLGHALRITIGTEAETRGVAAALRAMAEA